MTVPSTNGSLETSYQYDSLGRVKTITSPSGSTGYIYSVDTSTLGEPVNQIEVNDVLNRTSVTRTDARGRTVESIAPNPVTGNALDTFGLPSGAVTQMTYNSRGLLETTTNPANEETSYKYDNFDRLFQVSGVVVGHTQVVSERTYYKD